MQYYRSCPLCASEQISFHIRCKDNFLTGEEYDLYRCDYCNFVFTQAHPEEGAMTRYYKSEEYISHSDTSKGLSNKLYRLVRNLMLVRKVKLIKKITGIGKGNLLDVGCGTGYFGGAMQDEGWKVTGIEMDEDARKFASSRFNMNVISPGDISTLPTGSFDCITLWHVLEHFHNPYEYFSEIRRLLKPGGLCLVALPNRNSFDAQHYGTLWAAYDVPRHVWHFEPSTFNQFAKKAGFRCFGIRNLPFDVFYISILSEKYKGSGLSFVRGMINGKLFYIRSLFNIKRSSSILYLLRESQD